MCHLRLCLQACCSLTTVEASMLHCDRYRYDVSSFLVTPKHEAYIQYTNRMKPTTCQIVGFSNLKLMWVSVLPTANRTCRYVECTLLNPGHQSGGCSTATIHS